MKAIRIYRKNLNLEIVSKIMNSVAKKFDCCVKYRAADGILQFYGDIAYRRHIVEQTLSFFSSK